jgi:hypothetical protein
MASRAFGLYGDWSLSYLDAGNERGSMRGVGAVLTAANFDAQIALWDTFVSTINAITLGDLVESQYGNANVSNASLPTNGAARETKLLTMYQCIATGKRYTLTVPTLDPTIPQYIDNVSVKDAILTTAPTSIANYVTAFEAFVVAPDIPNLSGSYATDPEIEVIGLKVVGRNI